MSGGWLNSIDLVYNNHSANSNRDTGNTSSGNNSDSHNSMRIMENHPYLPNYNPMGGIGGGNTNSNNNSNNNNAVVNGGVANHHDYTNSYGAAHNAGAAAYDPLTIHNQQQQQQQPNTLYGFHPPHAYNPHHPNNISAVAHNLFFPPFSAHNGNTGGINAPRHPQHNTTNNAFNSIMAAAAAANYGTGGNNGNNSQALADSRAALNNFITGNVSRKTSNNSSGTHASNNSPIDNNNNKSEMNNNILDLRRQQQQQQQDSNHHRRTSTLTSLMAIDSSLLGMELFNPSDHAAHGLHDLMGAGNFLRDANNHNGGHNNALYGLAGNIDNAHGSSNHYVNPMMSSSSTSPLMGGMNDLYMNAHPLAVPSTCTSYSMPSKSRQVQPVEEQWLNEIEVNVPGLSLEPMSGSEVMRRLRQSTDDVVTRFIPCVEFLVQCQQDLRKGLAFFNARIARKRSSGVAQQFFDAYLEPLPQQFFRKNQCLMEEQHLQEAIKGIQKLNSDAKVVCHQGCEAVKNSFLGGMKEGESWGLRKWLSRNSNGLRICTDLECILKACQNLDKTADTTVRLAGLIRPLAEQAMKRLKGDIPASYQEQSAAHPYLPFFHRLESALRSVSTFDPTDDGIICLDDTDDDDEIEEIIVAPPPLKVKPTKPSRKRKADKSPVATVPVPVVMNNRSKQISKPSQLKQHIFADGDSSSGDSDDESAVEIVCIQNKEKSTIGPSVDPIAHSFLASNSSNDSRSKKGSVELPAKPKVDARIKREISEMTSGPKMKKLKYSEKKEIKIEANKLATSVENIATIFEKGDEHQMIKILQSKGFWSGKMYGKALRIFAGLMREWESVMFIYCEDDLVANGSYNDIVKHPLCFCDIVGALLIDVHDTSSEPILNDGKLKDHTLRNWNMWVGLDLFEAIDLVMLNSLGYRKIVGEGRTEVRSNTNKLRKMMWDEIKNTLEGHLYDDSNAKKRFTPTRRIETSGFVINKRR